MSGEFWIIVYCLRFDFTRIAFYANIDYYFPWSARRLHDIVNDRYGFGICLLVTDTRGTILDVIAIRKRQLQRTILPRDFAINYTPVNQSLTSLRNATAPVASYDQSKETAPLYPGHELRSP